MNLIFNFIFFTFYMQQNLLWCISEGFFVFFSKNKIKLPGRAWPTVSFDKLKQLCNHLHNQNRENLKGFIFTTTCTYN